MKYLADTLTFSRIIASVGLLVWALLDVFGVTELNYSVVLVIAVFAFLTDAFDGIAARRWPYSSRERARIPWHRSAESSHQFDNSGDLLLYVAVLVSLAAYNTIWWGVLVVLMVASAVINFTIERLQKRNSSWAEKIDVYFGWTFGLTLGFMLVVMAKLATPEYWGILVLIGVIVALAMVPSKWDRLTTRPERRVVRV